MAVKVGSVFFDLRASTDALRKDASKAIKAARRMGNDIALAMAAGAAAAGGGLAVIVKETAEKIDGLAKTADRMGVPIERLQALSQVAKEAGVEVSTMTGSMDSLRQQVFLAAAGSEKAGFAFRALGLDVKELITLSPDQMMAKVSDALNRLGNDTERAGLAAKMFGDTSGAMLQMLKGGSQSIDEAATKLENLGVALSRVDAAKVELANDAISDLKLVSEGAANQLTIALAPILRGIAQVMMKAAGDTHGFRDQIINLVDNGVKGVGLLADAFRGWQLIIKGGQIALIATAGAFEGFRKMGEVAILGLSAILAQAMKGFQELGLVIQMGFFAVMEKIKGGVQILATAISSTINVLYEAINKVAKTKLQMTAAIDIDTIDFQKKVTETSNALNRLIATPTDNKVAFDSSLKELNTFIKEAKAGTDEYSAAIKRTQGEIGELLDKPLPSDALKNWVAEIRAETQTAAEAVAAASSSVAPQTTAVNVEQLKAAKELHGYLWDAMTKQQMIFNSIEDTAKAMEKSFDGLIRGTESWNDALLNVANTFLSSVVGSFVQMGAQYLAQQAAIFMGVQSMQASAATAAVATGSASAAALSASWMPAAIAASIATMGSAAGVGTAAFVTAMALGTAAGVAIGGVGAIASGFVNAGGNAYGQSLAGARAQGGRTNAGSFYKINEKGPELFKPDSSGRVIPTGDISKYLNEGESSGPMVNITNHYASGLTRMELAGLAEQIKRDTLAAVPERISRGGRYRQGIRA